MNLTNGNAVSLLSYGTFQFGPVVGLEGSAAAMAVTAAPTRRVNPVAWMSSREKLLAGFGRHRNRILR